MLADDVREDSGHQSTANFVHAVAQFLRVLRYRKSCVFGTLFVASLFASIYYFSAVRMFEASASLLITQTSPDVWKVSAAPNGSQQLIIPTYERLFYSDVILDAAIEQLRREHTTALVDFAGVPEESWANVIRQNLTAHGVRRTNIIELQYRSRSPAAAEVVIGTIVSAYLAFIESNHMNESAEVVTILHDERQRVEAQLNEKNRLLITLKGQIRDFGGDENAKIIPPEIQRVVRLNETVMDTQGELLQLQASLAAVRKAIVNRKDLRQHLINLEPVAGDRFISDALGLNPQFSEILNRIERQVMEDRAELQSVRQYLGPAHPKVIRIQESIDLAETHRREYLPKVNQRLDRIQDEELGPMLVSMLEERISKVFEHRRRLEQEYHSIESKALQLNQDRAELSMAERDVERLHRSHDTLLDRIANLDISQQRIDIRVAVVSEPTANKHPVSPRLSTVVLFCLLLGVGGGGGLVYVLDLLDDRFRSPEELKEQLGAPVLAMIRDLPPVQAAGMNALQVCNSPDSVESEAFRTLRTSLAFSTEPTGCVGITSSEPGDGKTTVLANLAVTCAQTGRRTLLIDADMRRPGLTTLVNERGTSGLSDVLKSDGVLDTDCKPLIRSTGITNLDVLPCGLRPADPTELLSAPRFADFVGWAQTNYEHVLIDCPPVTAASDAAIVGRVADGMVLVVQPEKNHRRLVLRAVENLVGMGATLIGIVVNRVNAAKETDYYGYGYGYEYGGEVEEQEAQPDNDHQLVSSASPIVPRRAA